MTARPTAILLAALAEAERHGNHAMIMAKRSWKRGEPGEAGSMAALTGSPCPQQFFGKETTRILFAVPSPCT